MNFWTDDDGEALGTWVTIDHDEWNTIVINAGGLEALTVFSVVTDPDGLYGAPRIYTAWGRREDPYPLVDICDENVDVRRSDRTLRKFVPRSVA